MKNKGRFDALLRNVNGENKYVVVYIERGTIRDLTKYAFDMYDVAKQYCVDHEQELDDYVTSLKEEEAKAKAAREAAEAAKREEERIRKQINEENKKKRKNTFVRVIAGVLIGLVVGTPLGVLLSKNNSDSKKTEKDNTTVSQELDENELNIANEKLFAKFKNFLVSKGLIKDDSKEVENNNTITSTEVLSLGKAFFEDLGVDVELTDEEIVALTIAFLAESGVEVVSDLDIANDIENITTAAEELTTENFEKLVAKFAEPYVKNKVSLSTEDLTKFNAIMIIDRLSEENPELVKELFGVQSEEEFLNDAGKVIGTTYMYNHDRWTNDKNTNNFIWISEGIQENDPQKEKMQEIEKYVTRIAEAASKEDADEVNSITAELIESLTSSTGSLNALDDGVEFGAQIYWALINNSIARNYLTQEHRDYFNVRSTSETNISNIITVIEGCVVDAKSKGLAK